MIDILDISNNKNIENAQTELKLFRNFDYFNRRTEFPYDTIDNPLRLNPNDDT